MPLGKNTRTVRNTKSRSLTSRDMPGRAGGRGGERGGGRGGACNRAGSIRGVCGPVGSLTCVVLE
jgi:hypothetical protein